MATAGRGWEAMGAKGIRTARITMPRTLIVAVIVASSFAGPALADWWLVRSSDQECLVVDIKPTGKGVTKIGKDSYKTAEEAEADAKKLCKEPTLAPKLDSDED
jgi:hypothetical protein